MASKKPPRKQPLSVRAAHDPKLLAKALANPGLRSKLSDAQLSPAQRAKRQLNVKMSAPLVPGSSLTYRDAARQANAATAVKYGGAEQALGTELGHAQGLQRDTGDWYARYQADLAQHAQNVQGIGGQAAAQLAGQAQGIRGLDAAALGAQQSAADAAAAARGATAGNLGPDASNASTVRQAMLASMAGSQTGSNAANSTYADTLAKVVGPGQKLQALVQAAGKVGDVKSKQTALKAEKGAFNLSARQQLAADESKNVLAQQALSGKTAAQQAQDAIDAARLGETARHNRVSESNTAASRKAAAVEKAAAGDHYGYTNAQWGTMSPEQRRAAAKKWKDTTGKQAAQKAGEGPEWLTNQQMGAGLTQLTKLKDFANKAKSGQPFVPGHKPQTAMQRADAAKKIFDNAPSLKDPVLLSAALDAVYDGHLSGETVRRLIDAGYKPKRVAQTLGVPTAGQYRKSGAAAKPQIPSVKVLRPLKHT